MGSLGFIVLLTLLPTYIEQLGATAVVVGLFVTAVGVGRTLAVVPLGWAADRYDKRAILLVSLGMSAVAYGLFTVVDTATGFTVARTLQGLSVVGTGMVSLALVGALADDGERANQIGKYNSWRMAAGILGTLGAGVVFELFGFGPIFASLVALFGLAIVGVWLFLDGDDTREGFAFLDLALNDRILTITSFRAQYAVAVTLVRNWVPIFVGLSVARGGTAYGLVALTFPLAPAIGRSLDLAVAVPVLGTLPGVFFVVVGLNGLLGAADSVREPASMALFADEGKGSGITSSFGIRGLVWRPGALLAPLLGGGTSWTPPASGGCSSSAASGR